MQFAIVGCGRIAQRHAGHIQKVGKLVAVCDIKEDRARDLAKKYKAKYYLSIDELLAKEEEVDVVSVCTPNGLHAEHSIKALDRGKNVLCEKPMAIKTKDAQKMVEKAKLSKGKLFVVKQNRFNPPVSAVKELIDKGKLGKILSVQLSCFWSRNPMYYKESDWKGTKDMDGGTLFTQFSHFIDLLYWMIGDVAEAKAYRRNYLHNRMIDFEDTGVVILTFKNGAIGTINYTVNSYKKNMEGSLTLFGSKGTVKIGGQYLNELDYQEIEGVKIRNLATSNPPNRYGHYEGSMSNHDKVYENIIETLENNGRIATSGQEALKTVEIIEKIYKASRLK